MSRLDQIWNGWRAAYVADADAEARRVSHEGGSVFTQILASGLSDAETFIVHRGERCFAILNVYPYSVGHLLVLPYEEIQDLEDLDAACSAELWAMVTDGVRAIKAAYRPEGVNVGINMGRSAGGSIARHLHVHVVPRWQGDSNFMTSIANAATIPEPLDLSATKLRQAWPDTIGQ